MEIWKRSMRLDLEGSIHVGVFHDGESFLAVTGRNEYSLS